MAIIARTSPACLVLWTGDRRQTSGGLKNIEEAKEFR